MKFATKTGVLLTILIMVGIRVGTVRFAVGENTAQYTAQTPPASRVIAVYFHRTQRCPTCLRVSQTVAKVLKDHFAEQLRTGQLQWAEVDFQAPQNAHLAKAYQITSPQLVLIHVENGRVVEWQPMPKVWSLLIKPQELEQYVVTGVQGYFQKLAQNQTTPLR